MAAPPADTADHQEQKEYRGHEDNIKGIRVEVFGPNSIHGIGQGSTRKLEDPQGRRCGGGLANGICSFIKMRDLQGPTSNHFYSIMCPYHSQLHLKATSKT